MTLSVLLYALMLSTLVVLLGVLVVDTLGGHARWSRALEDRDRDMRWARRGWRSRPFTAQP
jgi:Tfp pilus assembly protein PilX